MAAYSLLLDDDVSKDLAKIPKKDVQRLLSRAQRLAHEPRPSQSQKLVGAVSTYRLRVGHYRIIYTIDDSSKELTVYHIRHRKDVYRSF